MARQHDFSEYVVYGVFVDHVLGEEASGHYRAAEDLVHAGWFFDLATDDGVEEFVNGFTPGQVGVAIQSTERFSLGGAARDGAAHHGSRSRRRRP